MSQPETPRTEAYPPRSKKSFLRWMKRYHLGWIVVAGVLFLFFTKFREVEGDRAAEAAPPRAASPAKASEGTLPRIGRPQHDIMAVVNGQEITRKALMDAAIDRHGEEVLESLVNKRLILNHCEKRGLVVTNEEIAAEIDRMAKRFKLSREQWFEMLEKERGISAQEYARDIVWPTLALRKLAADQIEVSSEEIERTLEREYGESINARMLAVGTEELANELHAQLMAEPDLFARLAIEHSIDVNSASIGGLIQPIRRHLGNEAIEREAFRLQPEEISSVLHVAGQYVILKCISRNAPRAMNRAEVEEQIVEKIKDEKLREVSHNLFADLQKSATLVNVYNDPQLSQTMPGVVATVNGDRISMKELGEECLLRHGENVLETEISHKLLEQSLEAAKLTVSDSDMDAEVRHAAELAGVVDERGQADLETWFRTIVEEQRINKAVYLRDAVWPSAALKKLTATDVQVTDEDIQKGFEANYGQRVRCRAIVLGNMRRAQEVWEKARRNSSLEYFGDLAEEYSIEPTSKSLRGEVPPIQRHGGQPQLENAAFQLQPGELSGIIQIRDKFLVLRCEGRTEQIDVSLNDVRDILQNDIYEKKLRMAMSEKFEHIRERSRIDNFLAGTSQAPPERTAGANAPVRRDTAVQPTSGARR